MTPTILLRDGNFYMAVGTPGGPTIINSVLQVIVNVLDFRMNLQEAVNQPRIHHQWLPDELRMERGFSPDTVDLLKSRGHQIEAGDLDRRGRRHPARWRLAGRRRRPAHRMRRRKDTETNAARALHASVRESSAHGRAAGPCLHAGIPAVEIFCARQHLDYRDKAQVTELGHWFRDGDLKLHSLHAPMYNDDIWGRSGPQAVITITETVKSKRSGDGGRDQARHRSGRIHSVPLPDPAPGRERRGVRRAQAGCGLLALEELMLFARQRGVRDSAGEHPQRAFQRRAPDASSSA